MGPILKKMNLKEQTRLVILDAPESFRGEIEAVAERGVVSTRAEVAGMAEIQFSLAFVMTQEGVDEAARLIAPKATGDPVVWFAYPKQSSRRYSCGFNRDTGWAALGELGFEPVRQVAIDEDWSALRFRRVEHIRTITRGGSMAMTDEAKRRTTGS